MTKISKSWVEWIQNKSNQVFETNIIDNLMTSTGTKVIELIDILDKEVFIKTWEIKIIKSIPKKEAHETWEFHQAWHIWIYNSKWEVLLQKRSKNKDSYPSLWDISVAGHISSWETMNEWILRELKEELWENLEEVIKNNKLELIFSYLEDVKRIMKWENWHNNELNNIYLLKYDLSIENLKMQEEEIEELKFIPIEIFDKEIHDIELSKKYVPQKQEYYNQVILEIKKRLY